MGTIQKSSLRLTFGFILAFTISVLLNMGLSTPSSAATSYKRINNQTIVEGLNYYVADDLVPPPQYSIDSKFWNIKKPGLSGVCEKYIDAQYSAAGPLAWTVNTSAKIANGNLCADSKASFLNPPLDNSGSNYFFYQFNANIIKPALVGSSSFEFTRITNGLGLAPKDQVYIQTKPASASLCPRLLVYNTSNHWGFIEPFLTNEVKVNNTESGWYRAALKLGGITGKDNCNADQGTDTQHQTEVGLSKLIGGTDAFWSKDQGWNPMDFYGLSVVKKLGNAVSADASATQIRDGTTPAGSVIAPTAIKGQKGDTTASSASSCAVDGIGWIVCPVLTFLGAVSDKAYGFIANNFLNIDVKMLSPTIAMPDGTVAENPTYSTWGTFRNIANVLFVIVFLIIVFSQMTSVGLNSYGVKKMLPRLVIAAILVNASYFIVLIAVDVSNILGYSLKSLFDTLPVYTTAKTTGLELIGQGLTWAVLLVGVLAAGAGIALAISAPVLLAALLSVIMTVLILVARQAIIVILVIISPIAFVAWLLPNTEQWFKKWWKMFLSLLMVFPVIGILFGASKMAATVMQAVGASRGDPLLQIIAMGVASIPLILVPSLLKNSLSATGALGAKLSGLSSKANSRLGGKVKNESRFGEAMKNRQISSIQNRARKRSNPDGWQRSLDNSSVGKRLGLDRGARAATQIADKALEEEVSAANTTLQAKSSEEVLALANESPNEAERTAAVRQVMKVGSHDEKRAVLANAHTASAKTRSSIRDGYYASGMNDVYGNGLGDAILNMENTEPLKLDDAMRANFGSMSAKTLVSGKKASTDIARVVNAAETSDEDRAKLSLAIKSVNESVELKDGITEDVQEQFDKISIRVARSTPQSPPPAGPPPVPPAAP